jgi:hypothetical protein
MSAGNDYTLVAAEVVRDFPSITCNHRRFMWVEVRSMETRHRRSEAGFDRIS